MLNYLQAVSSNPLNAMNLRMISSHCIAIRNPLSLFGSYSIEKEAVLGLKDSPKTRSQIIELLSFCASQSATKDKMGKIRELDHKIYNSRTLEGYMDAQNVVDFLKLLWSDDSLGERELFSKYIKREKNRLLGRRGLGAYHFLFRGAPGIFRRIDEGFDKIATERAEDALNGCKDILSAMDDFLQCKKWF
ncbi:hypothetical protein KAW65_08565 [candidate division WOR-3 bacterium]|nr:hypothetical protein [candidate division WOR-3 bacterium]